MKGFIKSLVAHALAMGVFHAVVWLLTILLTSSVFILVAQVFSTILAPQTHFRILVSLIFGIAGALISLALLYKFSRHRPAFDPIDFDFRVVEFEISYEYLPDGRMTYRKRKKLQALKDNLPVYQDRYRWTGSGSASAVSAIPGQVYSNTIRRSVWQLYEIRFPTNLMKDQEVNTELVWDLSDPAHTALPFVSATIEEPTDLLIMNVTLPPSFGVRQAFCEVAPSMASKKTIDGATLEFGGNGKVTWRIPPEHTFAGRPRLLHYYEMRWVI